MISLWKIKQFSISCFLELELQLLIFVNRLLYFRVKEMCSLIAYSHVWFMGKAVTFVYDNQ